MASKLKVIKEPNSRFYTNSFELRDVISKVNESGFYLYSYLRTIPFKNAGELTDLNIAAAIGWPVTKVKKYRLLLSAAELMLLVKTTDGAVRVIGELSVQKHNNP